MIICTVAVLHKGKLFRVFAYEGEDQETAFANVMHEDDVRDGILQLDDADFTDAEFERLADYFGPFGTTEWAEAKTILANNNFEIRAFYNAI